MSASRSLKAADKQKILKKLVTEMKKHVKGSAPKTSRSVLETLLFSACLENVNYEEAEKAYSNLLESFFDLNEIRVSSVTEIEHALGDVKQADWKALRIRETLQFVFEKYYAFDLELLKRKTQEAANKELDTIPHLSFFMRDYTVQHALAAHVLPIDEMMCQLLKWLALAPIDATPEQAGDAVKAGIKKTEGPQFCYLLKMVSTEPVLEPGLSQFDSLEEDVDPADAANRLAELYRKPVKPKAKQAAKTVSRKKPAAKTTKRKKTDSTKTTQVSKSVKKSEKAKTTKRKTAKK